MPTATARQILATRVELDIEGNQRTIATPWFRTDPRDRVVMRYDYDMLGNRIHQASMEAGERWMLNDMYRQADPRLGLAATTTSAPNTTRCAGR